MSIARLTATKIQGPFTQIGTVSTTETTLGTTIIPAQSLSSAGSLFHIIAFGTVANNSNAKTLTFYVGAATQAFTLQISAADSWHFEAWVVGNGTASQKSSATVICGPAGTGTCETYIVSSTENDLTNTTVKITGTATTTNDIICTGCLFLT